jgi:hypothetical protein
MIEPSSSPTLLTPPTGGHRSLSVWGRHIISKGLQTWKKGTERPRQRLSGRTASLLQRLLQGVLWAAFGAFLFASLPHVAYFFAAFEPESSTGRLNDYWWLVSYGLAASIDVTAFLLSLNVAIKMRQATLGLPWYQKTLTALGVITTHWPFILLLVGFSWLVNFEHAKQFHSAMLSAAEQVPINLLFWQGKLEDLNPIIASSFPLLAVAYTGMADQLGDAHQPTQDHTPQTSEAVAQPDLAVLFEQLQAAQTRAEQQQTMHQHTLQALAQVTEMMKTTLLESREQERAERRLAEAQAAERGLLPSANLPTTDTQQEPPPSREPAVVLQELTVFLPALAHHEANALEVIEMYQRGMDRSTIRDILHFGTNKYSVIIKAIGDAVQAGQVKLFAERLQLAQQQQSERMLVSETAASNLSLVSTTRQADLDEHSPQTEAMPALLKVASLERQQEQ